MDNNSAQKGGLSSGTIILLAIVLIAVIIGFAYYSGKDNRTSGERIGNAIDAAPQGLDKAAAQLENRSGEERAKDDANRIGDQAQSQYSQASSDIKANLDKQELKRNQASESSASSSSASKAALNQ